MVCMKNAIVLLLKKWNECLTCPWGHPRVREWLRRCNPCPSLRCIQTRRTRTWGLRSAHSTLEPETKRTPWVAMSIASKDEEILTRYSFMRPGRTVKGEQVSATMAIATVVHTLFWRSWTLRLLRRVANTSCGLKEEKKTLEIKADRNSLVNGSWSVAFDA